MDDKNVNGSRALISAVINLAIRDAIAVKRPKPADYTDYIKSVTNEYEEKNLRRIAIEARRFLSHRCLLFCAYCHMLDIDPEYFSEKIWRQIRLFDSGKRNIFKVGKCNLS